VINTITNVINAITSNQYEPQVGIVYEITEIVIRTSSGANPYTTNSPETLLNQFRNVWRTSPEVSIPRDMAHLFTGRNLSGSVIGIAWLASVCDSTQGFHYGLSQRLTTFSCMTDLVAHETGHNWSASHCSCSNSTMNSGLTCANTFAGAGSNSINQILNFKNSIGCLSPCVDPDPPANNECDDRIVVSDGSTEFNNEFATTEGPEESLCSFFGDTQVGKDVWFEYTATCTGEMTVALCDSDIVTKLAVYEGTACPTQPDTAVDCDVTGCANNRSTITLPVQEGESFIIRAGSRVDQEGDGVVNVTCEEIQPPACPGDFNQDDAVDGADLLTLLSDWGSCPGCESDLTGDDAVDGADLLVLLSNWGACP